MSQASPRLSPSLLSVCVCVLPRNQRAAGAGVCADTITPAHNTPATTARIRTPQYSAGGSIAGWGVGPASARPLPARRDVAFTCMS